MMLGKRPFFPPSPPPLPHIESLLFFACFRRFLSSQPEILGFDAAFWTVFIFCYVCGWSVLAFLAEDGFKHTPGQALLISSALGGTREVLISFSRSSLVFALKPLLCLIPCLLRAALGISFRSAVCIKQSLSYCLVSTTFFCSDR